MRGQAGRGAHCHSTESQGLLDHGRQSSCSGVGRAKGTARGLRSQPVAGAYRARPSERRTLLVQTLGRCAWLRGSFAKIRRSTTRRLQRESRQLAQEIGATTPA